MARFSFNGERNTNYKGCQPYQAARKGSSQPALPEPKFKRPDPVTNPSLVPQQILSQIMSHKNNPVDLGGGSSSNNSSSSRTGISHRHKINDHCDMNIQTEYENVRPPMQLPPSDAMQPRDDNAPAGKGRRRVGRQESRYTSGKIPSKSQLFIST